ncbi:MAG: hypothetical protein ACTSRZ_15820 [Promethearchaeota archaeon]
MITLIQLIGLIGFIFRIWITKFKLKEILGFRRFYFSRMLALYFCIDFIFDLRNLTFNFVCTWSIPFLLFAIIGWDTKFFKKLFTKNIDVWKNHKFWLLIERITLHIPQFIFILCIVIVDFHNYLFGFQASRDISNIIISFIIGTIILYITFIFFDTRFSKKHGWPVGRNLLILGHIPLIFLWIYFFKIFIF